MFPTSLESTTDFKGLALSPFFSDLEQGKFKIILDSQQHSAFGPGIKKFLNRYYEPGPVFNLPMHRPGGTDEFIIWSLRNK